MSRALSTRRLKPEPEIALTGFSSCAGCAAKLSQPLLHDILRSIPSPVDERLLVGAASSDDAAVYCLSATTALVQTIDFFTPIVDDPTDYGKIAATNAISDVYAMGGTPLTAMNVLAVPTDKLAPQIVTRILKGGASKVREAGAVLVGGHTIRSLEPIYGLSVTGLVNPKRMMTNAAARSGDVLVLTKPLGTGVATTGIKRKLASPQLIAAVTRSMQALNRVGHELAAAGLVRAATDVTGFGLLGHLGSMCRASGVGARLIAADVPAFSNEVFSLIEKDCVPGGTLTNLQAAETFTRFAPIVDRTRRLLLADAQTSGGLLLSVSARRVERVLALLHEHRTLAASVIGQIVKGRPLIEVA